MAGRTTQAFPVFWDETEAVSSDGGQVGEALAVGSPDQWQLAFDQGGIWGLIEGHEAQWQRLAEGDLVFFYAKSPVSGLVGFGRITKTFRQNSPPWPPEVASNKVIWPLRFELDVLYRVPTPRWKQDKVRIEEIPQARLQSGFLEISPQIADQWSQRFPKEFPLMSVREPAAPAYKPVGHGAIQTAPVEIGSMQRFIAEKEYPMDKERLDVVWRRVVWSVSTYV